MTKKDKENEKRDLIRAKDLNHENISYFGVGFPEDKELFKLLKKTIKASPIADKVIFVDDEGNKISFADSVEENGYLMGKYKYEGSNELFEIFYDDQLGFDGEGEPEEWVTLVKEMLIVADDYSRAKSDFWLFGVYEF